MSKGPLISLTFFFFVLECNFIILYNCQSPQDYSRYFNQQVIQYIQEIYKIVGRARRMHSKLSLQKLLPVQTQNSPTREPLTALLELLSQAVIQRPGSWNQEPTEATAAASTDAPWGPGNWGKANGVIV